MVHPRIKEHMRIENSEQAQLSSSAAGCSNLRNNSHKEDVIDSTKSCQIPHRKLPENGDSILIPGIRNFLPKCYNSAVKRRRSSRVCKHIPGIKHYCRHRNSDTILSKHKAEVLDNPLIDLGTFCKPNCLSTKKELLMKKQKNTQNKAEPLVLTSDKEHNAEAENTANLDEISGSIDIDSCSIDVVEESTNKIGLDISSECMNLEEVRDKGFQDLIDDDDHANPENIEHFQEEKDEVNTSSEKNTEYINVQTTQNESRSTNQSNGDGAHENVVSSLPQECSSHSEKHSCQVKPTHETCKSLQSCVGVNNLRDDTGNILKNVSLNVTCLPAQSSMNMKCETSGHITNNHEEETNNIGNYYVISSFLGPFPRNSDSRTCAPRQKFSSAGELNGVFPNFYGSPCFPRAIHASQVFPVFAHNVLPMNKVLCASHPNLMPFPTNGGYVPTSFGCTSQQSVHHSLPLSFYSGQSNPSNIYHKPGFHQWIDVNTSARVPCWSQITLPCTELAYQVVKDHLMP